MTSLEHMYDLVVVGSGIAGQVAATSAAEAGLRVALLEKGDAPGGSSAMSGGFLAFSSTAEQADEGVADSTELFRQDLLELGQHLNNPALVEAYLDHQDSTYKWLKNHGVTFRALELSSGQSAARSHNCVIKDVLATLRTSFRAAGGQMLLNHQALRLVQDPSGRVTGIVALTPGGEERFTADGGIILATGGFSRSLELLKTFAPEQLAAIPYGGKGNTGDGLKMAWKLGADLADMAFISGTYGSHPDTGDEFHELLTAYYMGAIIVNTEGRRFVDESQSYKTLGREVLKQPEGLGFEIFDAKVRAKSHPGIPLSDIGFLENIGHVFKADTLQELGRLAGIEPNELAETVQRYNASVAKNQTDDVGRSSLCNGVGERLTIDQAPYYAYPAKSLMTSTYCGLKVNADTDVVDVDGNVIAGLHAIGEVTGGFHGAAYMTGTSLGKGAIFGRIAAAQVAQRLARSVHS